MPSFKIPGVKVATAKGRTYYYHRATNTRINADPNDAVAFIAEVAALNKAAPIIEKPLLLKTLGGLITAYMGGDDGNGSPEWDRLSTDTHKSYLRAFEAIKTAGLYPVLVNEIDQRVVIRTRDAIYKARGRWLANMTVSVMSVVLGWGVPRGYSDRNGAAGVPKIRRNKSAGVANKAWTLAEVDVALKRSTGGLRKAIALAYFAGQRKKDVVEIMEEERTAAGIIERLSSKPGVSITVFEAKRLTDILNEPDVIRRKKNKSAAPAKSIVKTTRGASYTRDGLDTMFHRLKAKLVEDKLIRPGLTFHGLRKSMGKDAADLGFSENDIAGALGQRNPASARPYTIEAKQRDAARRVIRGLERKGKR